MSLITVEPCTFALFGALGDLALRKLFPALYQLDRAGLLHSDTRILALAREPGDALSHLAHIDSQLRQYLGPKEIEDEAITRFLGRLSYLHVDFLEVDDYVPLAELAGTAQRLIAYFATPAAVYGAICEHLSTVGLAENTRVVLEKPIGSDLDSSRKVNDAVAQFFPENRIYRIDHYLGKETVQNILVSRFSNGLFESFWNNHYIDHVQITAAETVGVETRGAFYDSTGALRDMVPNHLFQLLAMVAMEPPAAFGADAVRGEKAKVVGAIRPWSAKMALKNSVRGQYSAGKQGRKQLPGYRQESNVAPDSQTETYVALKVMIDNWRWAGVPFYLRTGKRMSVRDTEIAICFKPAPYAQFRESELERPKPNYLKIQIQPNEGMWFDLQAKRPGPELVMENVELGFAYKDFFKMTPATGYETLIYDCLTGDQTLFQRADNIENGWRAVQPFLDAWAQDGEVHQYPAGEDGPDAGNELLTRDKREWHRLG